MTETAFSARLPVPITRPSRVPAVVRASAADRDRRRDAAEAYAGTPHPRGSRQGPRGRMVDLLV